MAEDSAGIDRSFRTRALQLKDRLLTTAGGIIPEGVKALGRKTTVEHIKGYFADENQRILKGEGHGWINEFRVGLLNRVLENTTDWSLTKNWQKINNAFHFEDTLRRERTILQKNLKIDDRSREILDNPKTIGDVLRGPGILEQSFIGGINFEPLFRERLESWGLDNKEIDAAVQLFDLEKDNLVDLAQRKSGSNTAREILLEGALRREGLSVVEVPPLSLESHTRAFAKSVEKKIKTFLRKSDEQVWALNKARVVIETCNAISTIWQEQGTRGDRIARLLELRNDPNPYRIGEYGWLLDGYTKEYGDDNPYITNILTAADSLSVWEARYQDALSQSLNPAQLSQISGALEFAQIRLFDAVAHLDRRTVLPSMDVQSPEEARAFSTGIVANLSKSARSSNEYGNQSEKPRDVLSSVKYTANAEYALDFHEASTIGGAPVVGSLVAFRLENGWVDVGYVARNEDEGFIIKTISGVRRVDSLDISGTFSPTKSRLTRLLTGYRAFTFNRERNVVASKPVRDYGYFT